MRILLSNDDGFQAPGLRALMHALAPIAELDIVAPEGNRSGASNSLTLDRPLRAYAQPDGVIAVNGSPADCVHLALTGLLPQQPDMVISGINMGANLGDDALYSGTVGAAMEGRFLSHPAIAVSTTNWAPRHLETAARAVVELLGKIKPQALPPHTVLNVNVPDLPWSEIRGYQITRLGRRQPSEALIATEDPRGHKLYWIGGVGSPQDGAQGTDFHATSEGYVSITPLCTDLTCAQSLGQVSAWFEGAAAV